MDVGTRSFEADDEEYGIQETESVEDGQRLTVVLLTRNRLHVTRRKGLNIGEAWTRQSRNLWSPMRLRIAAQ